jgi:hypothetical protein
MALAFPTEPSARKAFRRVRPCLAPFGRGGHVLLKTAESFQQTFRIFFAAEIAMAMPAGKDRMKKAGISEKRQKIPVEFSAKGRNGRDRLILLWQVVRTAAFFPFCKGGRGDFFRTGRRRFHFQAANLPKWN